MASIARIQDMRAQILTVMSTRSQDQQLVSSVASDLAINSEATLFDPSEPKKDRKIVPAFGWHPWFSHQLYDDTNGLGANANTFDSSPSADPQEEKYRHYCAVLSPRPDGAFVASLPDPQPLSGFLAATRTRLEANPLALVGEVGLDKAFRLPVAWGSEGGAGAGCGREEGLTPGGREGRLLSPHRVKMPHQVHVLAAQLRLAGELGRSVSLHGVQAHGILFDALSALWEGHERKVVSRKEKKRVAPGAEHFSGGEEDEKDAEREAALRRRKRAPVAPRPFPPRICLHSFSGPLEVLKQYLNPKIPSRIFFSFSVVINLSTPNGAQKFPDIIRACPDDQILIESDLHTAGEDMDRLLEQMYRSVCVAKGWKLRSGVERIRMNYEEFILG